MLFTTTHDLGEVAQYRWQIVGEGYAQISLRASDGESFDWTFQSIASLKSESVSTPRQWSTHY
jgi:hypothetical protein